MIKFISISLFPQELYIYAYYRAKALSVYLNIYQDGVCLEYRGARIKVRIRAGSLKSRETIQRGHGVYLHHIYINTHQDRQITWIGTYDETFVSALIPVQNKDRKYIWIHNHLCIYIYILENIKRYPCIPFLCKLRMHTHTHTCTQTRKHQENQTQYSVACVECLGRRSLYFDLRVQTFRVPSIRCSSRAISEMLLSISLKTRSPC